jgi:hypothetical protein
MTTRQSIFDAMPRPTTGPWRVETRENEGHNWLIASLGASEDGKDYIVTTDGVHASEYDGDAKSDAEFIVWARNNFLFLWNAYVDAVLAGKAPAPDVSWSEWHDWIQRLREWNEAMSA